MLAASGAVPSSRMRARICSSRRVTLTMYQWLILGATEAEVECAES